MSTTFNTSYVNVQFQTGEAVTQNTVTTQANFTHQTASATAPLVNGSGAGQAQHCWTNTITVNTTGTTLSLQSLTNGLDGGTRNFSAIKGFLIENLDGTNSLAVGNAASFGWTGVNGSATTVTTIGPGGHIERYEPTAAGLATSGTNLNLLLAASAATVSVKISFIGIGT